VSEAFHEKKTSPLYRAIKAIVRACFPRMEIVGAENLPEGEAVLVGNHAQMNGPIACELFFPGNRYTWCAGQMMHLKEVPAYAYQDFWSQKPRSVRWLYKIASYLIAPLSVLVFNNANTIPVYHDARVLTTFRTTLQKLQEGAKIVIFPEQALPQNNIVCAFQDRFVDLARMYHTKTRKELDFVPMYICPALKKIVLGKPVRFRPGSDTDAERARICRVLTDEISALAYSLPRHRVVPYLNIPKKDYPHNLPTEVNNYEEASR